MSEVLIYKAMCNAMADISAIAKDRRNVQQGFQFRGIDDVYNELHDILAKHKIFTVPEVMSDRTEERTTKNGGNLIYRILNMKYTFYAEDGSNVYCVVTGEGMDSGDKAANKAMSIAHKYALFQTFLIPTEDDKDPDAESHQTAPKTTQKKSEPKPAPSDSLVGTFTVVEVLKRNGTNKTTGKAWTKFIVKDDLGTEFGTFSETDALFAKESIGSGVPVRITYTVTKFGNDLVSIRLPNEDEIEGEVMDE